MNTDKPIIGVDGNEANVENRVGVNTYAFELLKNIHILEDEWNDKITILIYLKNKPLSHMPKPTPSFQYRVLPGGGQWIIKTLMPFLYRTKEKPAVFWSPSHYVPPFAPMPRVCSIMDLGYLEFSSQFRKYDFWQLKLWSAWSIRFSSKVIAISDTTRKDIVKRYPFARQKTVTTLLGFDTSNFPPKTRENKSHSILTKYSIGREYLLFMSTLKPSKNIEGLLTAWSRVEHTYPQTKLVIAGKKGWLFDSIFTLAQKLSLEDRVVFTDFIAEDDKPELIANAKAFILPSFWEGFGLDVVSSMACGVPVIVSDRGSLPEVVGKAGVVVNPDSAESIADGIDRVLGATKSEYEALSKRGIERARDFDWEKTARETIAVLRDTL